MIPKIIHWGLFGGWPKSDLNRRCMESWAKVLPDYHVYDWDDQTGPRASRFFREALERKPVNASNYIKLWALHTFGGVFLDTDVEVIKPFDLTPGMFVGFQRSDTKQDCINGAVIAARPGHPLIRQCLTALDELPGDACPILCGCSLLTETLYSAGMKGLNEEQMLWDMKIYDKQAFYPWFFNEEPDLSRITEKTFAVHHWEGSWLPKEKHT